MEMSLKIRALLKWDQFSTDSIRQKAGRRVHLLFFAPLSESIAKKNNESPAQAGDAGIEVRDVRCTVGGRAIFDGLDITARRGRITAFMGPSGTGKTTLLRLITGQAIADRGSVRVFGDEVATMANRELFALRRR